MEMTRLEQALQRIEKETGKILVWEEISVTDWLLCLESLTWGSLLERKAVSQKWIQLLVLFGAQ